MSLKRAGTYTSYVLIGSHGNDEVTNPNHGQPVVIGQRPNNRIVVSVKEIDVSKSGRNTSVELQDGRASNVSIVSTESSDLASHPFSQNDRLHHSPKSKYCPMAGRESFSDHHMQQHIVEYHQNGRQDQRSRGGEWPDLEHESSVIVGQEHSDEDGDNRGAHQGFFNCSSEFNGTSYPPMIRSAGRQQVESIRCGGYDFYNPGKDFELGCHDDIDEINDLKDDHYDQESETSFNSGSYLDYQDYTNNSDEFNCDQYCNDEYFDQEEELRGYNRHIDFTLHTILEESGEESDFESREPDDNQIVHHHQTRKMTRLSDPSEMEKYFLYDVGGSSRPTDEFQTDTSGNNSSSIVASGSESDTSSTCENTFYFGSNEKRLHYDELETFVATKVKNSKERCKREECGNLKFDPPVTPCPKEIIQVKSAPRSYSVSKYDGGTEATQLTSVWRRDDVQNSISRNENQTLEYYTNGVEEYLKNEGIKLPNLFDRVFQFSDKSSPNDLSENLILNASLESQIKMSEMGSKPFEDLDDRRKNTCDDGKTYINHCNTWIGRKSQSTSSNIATFQIGTLSDVPVQPATSKANERFDPNNEVELSSADSLPRCEDSFWTRETLKGDDNLTSHLRRFYNPHYEGKVAPTGRQFTNSLPRMGTSAIQMKTKVRGSTNSDSEIQTSLDVLTRAYGASTGSSKFKDGNTISNSMERTSLINSSSTNFADENSDQWSSKSASPSPVMSGDHHGVASSWDCRNGFVHSKNSSDHFGIDADSPDTSVPRDDSTRYPIQFGKQLQHGGSTISLMDGGRYGTVIVCGEVKFSLSYNILSGSLDVVVKQCRDLAAVDSKRNRSDPYVKVYLLPDKSKSGKRKTKVKKHTLNPVFEEVLKFPMSLIEVERRTLWLSVWHSDMFGKNDFLGEVMLPLYGQQLDDSTPKWHCLMNRHELVHKNPCGAISRLGELVIALKFVPPISENQPTDRKSSSSRRSSSGSYNGGSLLVSIKEAKNLVAKGGRVPNVFCKCYLLPSNNDANKRKTPICRKSTNPQWDHTLQWDGITKPDLDNMSLEITVWNHESVPRRHKECLGGARFNHGTGEHRGKAVFWMDASDYEIHLWQQMLDRSNFWVEGSVFLRSPKKS